MTNNITSEDLQIKNLTPMMKHWFSVKQTYKEKYPNHVIAYRMGDFYEFFYDDAVRVSALLGITLTQRKIGSDAYPLAGIPYHASSYIKNLVNLGQTVVVVDQLEDPTTVKGRIVKRGVVRIMSPGTIIEPDMLNSQENNYLCSLIKERRGFGIAFVDISTGEFVTTEYLSKHDDPQGRMLSLFSQYDPVEVIIPSELKKDEKLFLVLNDLTNALLKSYDDFAFNFDNAYSLITRHFEISNLEGFGIEDNKLAIQASGGLLAFLKETQRDILPNIFKINSIQEGSILHLDYVTQRNLELVSSLWEKGKDVTLFSIFNLTHTPMGARLLKKIMLQPLTNIEEINGRLSIVQKFKDDVFLRSDLREELKILGDLERHINRINYSNNSNARDLIHIKNSLEKIPKIKILLEKSKIPEIDDYLKNIDEFREIRSLIEVSIRDDPPTTIKEGNMIKFGFDEKVDELIDLLQNGKKYILDYEEEQKSRLKLTTGIKIGHNNILGYYIQITFNTLRNISKIPDEYVERQTLKNAKRYTSAELKKLEEKIVVAEEKINDLEHEIYSKIREKVVGKTIKILETAKSIAFIDVLSCFAEIAEKYNYSRPIISHDDKIIIKQGRHPVVEQINLTDQFIPNDCYLDTKKEQILIITGPNMAGKSTYLRQVALICIIAQMGCFVPAQSAKIGIVDKIFTRIGASDDLARRLSTFMIEMTETAKILHNSTQKSLIIIDELGRGTSTSDGQSIAMATLEKLHEIKAKTLFSTHYHQLTEIDMPRIKNYHLDIIENDDGSINFIRKLRTGSTDKSYGIHVAKLAGLPDDVIIRAFEILDQIEDKDPFKATVKENGNGIGKGKYHEKYVEEKKIELEKLTIEVQHKLGELNKCEEDLSEKERDLGKKSYELEEIKKQLDMNLKQIINTNIAEENLSKKKKYVQTTLFNPISTIDKSLKNVIEEFNKIDLNSMTPIDAMKKLIELKEFLTKS
ncbi:MAG: DNA mismatch repair protein MutS [Candidatus Lokiarchaeota archaeon]|nr:DNA mismatch repair protein MutS [Candidatus Lokiarchaeota archaeon]